MSRVIGIQLGRRNSIAAFKSIQVETVTADDNIIPDRKLTPSVVAYEQGKLLVGQKAYNQLRADPENVIVSIVDLMGRGFSDSFVQNFRSHVSYKITEPTQGTENGIAVWLGGKEYQPEDIAAEILKKLVQNAQHYTQAVGRAEEVINQAVITIPAYFNDKQRQAIRTAALKAGLTPLELLPEPTAAAISYGYSPDSTDVKTILVYDFGAETFDATLITAAGTQFIENGKVGDLWLGGDDIDSRIIQFVKEQVAKQEGLSDIDSLINKIPYYQRVRFRAELKKAVEHAKVELSNTTKTRIEPATPLIDDLGLAIPIEVEITREQFEAMITPLVERSIEICHQALQLSEYPPEMVDVVLLVGGSSQIPLVQRKLKEAFGADKVVVHPRPMYAVAEGAAIVAAGLTDPVSTVSRDYFIKLPSNPRYKVISQGDILPVTKSHTFKTVADGQRLIHFEVFSPDQVKESLDGSKGDELIGEMWLGLDQHYPRGTEVMVNLELDEKNSDLKFRATLKNDPSVSVSCTFSRGRSDEKIYKELQQAIDDLNSRSLPAATVEEAMKLAVPVVRAANQIIDLRTGEERLDMRDRAQTELAKFKTHIAQITNNNPNHNNSSMSSEAITPGAADTQMISNPHLLNPYDILGVSPAASRAEITRAVAVAMRQRRYPVDVIAKAQRSLMKSEERIIADYLRPIVPIIRRFKNSDLSALEQPAPTLVLLSEFDGLDGAIAQAAAEERLEWEPLPKSLPELLAEGMTACQTENYAQAVR